MPIARDLSDLPRSPGGGESGWAPDATPRFGTALVDAWYAEEQARDSERLARFRHSDAGACARAIAYAALDVPESNPIDPPGVFITTQGQKIHEHWQEALRARHGGAATTEVKVKVGDDRGGHLDAEVYLPMPDDAEALNVCVEAKSVGGFSYKRAIGCPPASRTPMGPSYDHIIQVCLNAKARNADEAVILYLTREAISIQAAERNRIPELLRVIAEWTIDRDTIERVSAKEIERVTGILALVDEGMLPRRKIPDPELPAGHIIEKPRDGSWVEYDSEGTARDAGSTWHCHYCRYQTLCISTKSDRMTIIELDDAITSLGLPRRPGSAVPRED